MTPEVPKRPSRRQFLLGTGGVLGAGATWGVLPLVTADGDADGRPIVVGHRGAEGLEPPNTIAGIRRALEVGVDGVELDVRRTSDGRLVLFHDPVLDWNSTGSGWIENTAWRAIEGARIGGEPIPTLEDALAELATARSDVDLYLELKADCAPAALDLVGEYGLRDRLTMLSFSDAALEPVQEVGVPAGIVGSLPTDGLVDDAESVGSQLVLSHYLPWLSDWFVDEARSRGLTTGLWKLADTEGSIRDALEAEPDVLVTNRPDTALKLLD